MILTVIFLFILFDNTTNSKLYTFIKTVSVWTLVMYFGTELLSVFSVINFYSCWLFWILIDFVLISIIIKKFHHSNSSIISYFKEKYQFLAVYLTPYAFILISIAFVTFFLALKTVPNNYDSMTYRLPRIMHWVQNGSVAHYATNSVRQVTSPVLTDFLNLYVYIMTGSRDYFFNLVQWSAYITNTILIIGLAIKLSCNRNMCFLAAFIFMTTPISFAESMTTQNDQFSAMWLLFFVYILIDLYTCKQLIFNKQFIEKTVILSLCLAFAYLAKPSVMFAVMIFAGGLLIICIKRHDSIKTTLQLLCCSAGTIIFTVVPEILRNLYTFHSISAPIAGAQQLVGTSNPKLLLVNFLKNITFNSPNVYFDKIDEWIENKIYKISELLNVDINDYSISENGLEFEMHPARLYHHDSAINPVLFWSLVVLIPVIILLYKKLKFTKLQIVYCSLSLISICIFCVFLRWEKFISRYMIGYFALLCPVIVIFLRQLYISINSKIYYATYGIIFFVSITELFNMIDFHYEESIIAEDTRAIEYFHNANEEYFYTYEAIVNYIKDHNLQTIGLASDEVSYVYPLWPLLRNTGVTINYIGVKNDTAIYEDANFTPDCIIALRGNVISDYHENTYVSTEIENEVISLYIKK